MQYSLIGAVEFGIAEKAEQFDCGELAALLANVSHLQYRKNQTANDDKCAENFGHVGQSR